MLKVFKPSNIITKLSTSDVRVRSGNTSVVGVQFGTLALEFFAGLSVSLLEKCQIVLTCR